MTSELSFLLDLLLNQRMPLTTKELIVERIKVVESNLSLSSMSMGRAPISAHGASPIQAPSTLAAMARHGDYTVIPPPEMPPIPITPVAVIAQTAPAVAAMNARNQAISESLSGKIDKSRGSPRKF